MRIFSTFSRFILVLSVISFLGAGLVTKFAVAADEKDPSSRVVLVECDKGQSVTQTLVQFANDTKPLEIIIRGNCVSEDEVQIERNMVELVGDEEIGGTIPFMLIDGGRQIGIGDNLTLASGLFISAGAAEIGTETNITVNGTIFLSSQSLLRITTEAPEDDEESINGTSAGQVVINGFVVVENHSLLEVQREVNGGNVIFNDEINLNLQSSLWIRDATTGNVVLGKDSHAFFGENVLPKYGPGGNWIACDRESRVWGNTTSGGFTVFHDPDGMSCQGD